MALKFKVKLLKALFWKKFFSNISEVCNVRYLDINTGLVRKAYVMHVYDGHPIGTSCIFLL